MTPLVPIAMRFERLAAICNDPSHVGQNLINT